MKNFSWKNGTARVIAANGWAARVLPLPDRTLIAGYESRDGIHTRLTGNLGESWYGDMNASFAPERACANVNFFLDGDQLYLAYRAIGPDPQGYYTSLRVSVSDDFGRTWKPHSVVCEYREPGGRFRGVWEPYLGRLNGKLTCFYANDSTSITKWQNIESLTWNGSEWTDRTVVSEGEKHRSRDGMPVWIPLREGGYALAIESSHRNDEGYPFVIRLLTSPDGIRWSEPKDVYTPTSLTSKAGAPGIAQLDDGRIVLSFQTDEDASVKGDRTSIMKTVLSDGTPCAQMTEEHFSASANVFGTPDGQGSTWTGICISADGILFAAGGTPCGAEMKWGRVS